MFHEAILCYLESLKSDPNHFEPYYNLGSAYHELSNLELAEKYYQKAISLNPNHYMAYYNMGCIYQELGKVEQSIDCYLHATSLNPNDAEAHLNLGITLRLNGKHQEAAFSYLKAIEADPRFVPAYFNLGNTYQDLGKLDKAILCFLEALKHDPEYVDAMYNLAICYLDRSIHLPESKITDLNNALACYEKIQKISPGSEAARKGHEFVRSILEKSVIAPSIVAAPANSLETVNNFCNFHGCFRSRMFLFRSNSVS